ncbi:MAG: LytTR family transcriptional regulator DNA-binding domain-containing protein [Kiritimatiellia bacterium]
MLVNASSIDSLQQLPDGRASITLCSGKRLTVSRNAARRTRQILLNTF